MLYVSITRARSACIISFAGRRVVHGEMRQHSPSRFAQNLNGAFAYREQCLTDSEVAQIMADCGNL